MVGKIWGEVDLFLDQEGGLNFFSDTERGSLICIHVSLANSFNKCYKKAVFMKKIEFGYM